ncbi:unnamed protein product [Amoebophrya sp. A120]|nr:unnamed protein product [Amoebophrya sp. A120]|eukprot:GSA120T00005365001.1
MDFVGKESNVLTKAADCLICHQDIQDRVLTTNCCGKFFCEACRDVYKKPVCPHCRKTSSNGYEIARVKFIEMQLDSAQVKCQACHETMTRKQFRKEHCSSTSGLYWEQKNPCAEAVRSCPHSVHGCKFQGKLADMQKHLGATCKRGYRLLDAQAVEMCGGREGLKASVKLIESVLKICPPISPEALQCLLKDAQTQLTARIFIALASHIGHENIKNLLSPRNVFVELQEGASSSVDGAEKVAHICECLFSSAVGNRAKKEDGSWTEGAGELWSAYREVLKGRVVDRYNLLPFAQRANPKSITLTPIGRALHWDSGKIKATWRNMFGLVGSSEKVSNKRPRTSGSESDSTESESDSDDLF